jgi:hypothetical protein
LVVAGLAALPLATPAAWAQDRSASPSPSPSPSQLWEAYPLVPQDAPATATPSEAATESAASPAPRRAASSPTTGVRGDDGGGVPLAVPIGLAALLAFGAGMGIGRVRRRDRLERVELERVESGGAPAQPPAPKRFQWRDYPEPARPAPPPPPPPPVAPTFKAALEEQRAAASTRAKQEEPH